MTESLNIVRPEINNIKTILGTGISRMMFGAIEGEADIYAAEILAKTFGVPTPIILMNLGVAYKKGFIQTRFRLGIAHRDYEVEIETVVDCAPMTIFYDEKDFVWDQRVEWRKPDYFGNIIKVQQQVALDSLGCPIPLDKDGNIFPISSSKVLGGTNIPEEYKSFIGNTAYFDIETGKYYRKMVDGKINYSPSYLKNKTAPFYYKIYGKDGVVEDDIQIVLRARRGEKEWQYERAMLSKILIRQPEAVFENNAFKEFKREGIWFKKPETMLYKQCAWDLVKKICPEVAASIPKNKGFEKFLIEDVEIINENKAIVSDVISHYENNNSEDFEIND